MLTFQSANHIQQHGKHKAEENGRGQREVERSVLAAVDDVAGKASDGQVGAAEKHEYKSHHEKHRADDKQEFAEFCHDLESKSNLVCESWFKCRKLLVQVRKAFGSSAETLKTRAGLASCTGNVGADALVCRAEGSSADFDLPESARISRHELPPVFSGTSAYCCCPVPPI